MMQIDARWRLAKASDSWAPSEVRDCGKKKEQPFGSFPFFFLLFFSFFLAVSKECFGCSGGESLGMLIGGCVWGE